jgi:hypothetical protein
MRSLTLFIPGLLGLVRDLNPEDIPAIPSIEYLFARGHIDRRSAESFSNTLCQLFNLQISEVEDAPIAAISHLVDDDHSQQGFWMRADPVHLAADNQGVVLMDETSFTLDQHDALVLAAEIKEILADSGFMLEAPTTNRWYIKLEELPSIKTTPIHEVVGRDIHQFMPTGENKQKWAMLINEIQMALHASQLNEVRQQRGELPINSVWFWGVGELPQQTQHSWTKIFTDDVITTGFAKHTQTSCYELPDRANLLIEKINTSENVLAVIAFGLRHAQYHDIEGWLDFISYLEEFWFADLLNYLKSGEMEKLTIITKKREITVTKSSLYKIWKRPKSICQY